MGEEKHHEIYYMHQQNAGGKTFQTLLPSIFKKLVDAVAANDSHGCLQDRELCRDYNVRCIEYHIYTPGGALRNPKHSDIGTIYTIGILLADPESFDGGIFQTLEPDGSTKQYLAKQGDAMIWPGHKYHSVSEITN